jgi:hypothetical protein
MGDTFSVQAVRFAAIKHPVRVTPGTTEIDRGPLRHEGRTEHSSWSSFDMYQQTSAENYAREAHYLEDDQCAFASEGPGERKYAFTGEDAPAVGKLLREDEELIALKKKVEEAEEALAAAEEAKMARHHAVVQGYLEKNADRIEEVPYKYDYKMSKPVEPLKAVASAVTSVATSAPAKKAGNWLLWLLTAGYYNPKPKA